MAIVHSCGDSNGSPTWVDVRQRRADRAARRPGRPAHLPTRSAQAADLRHQERTLRAHCSRTDPAVRADGQRAGTHASDHLHTHHPRQA